MIKLFTITYFLVSSLFSQNSVVQQFSDSFADVAEAAKPAVVTITIETLSASLEKVDPFIIHDSANLLSSTGEKYINIYLLPGLRRGDVILVDNFLTTVKYNEVFNSTHIPIVDEGNKNFNSSIKRFRYDYRNGKSDFVSFKNTNLFIIIDDDGPGIPNKEHENVFKPFYKIDKGRSDSKSSVGLGLSIASDIVRSHGGSIMPVSYTHLRAHET